MKGRIHSFQSLGTVDGPGVRCVVFMQGCPLRCVCCHNPDTWNVNDGEETETPFIMEKILRCRSYFGTRGGVTISGGEPLLQISFVTELFSQCKNAGIHTALDTSGCLYNEDVDRLLDLTDLVLLDHKYDTEEEYWKYCRGSLTETEHFLTELERKKIPTWLRRVIIPGLNDTTESVRHLQEAASHYSCVQKVELLPFRKLCLEKYQTLGIPFPLEHVPEMTEEKIRELEQAMR